MAKSRRVDNLVVEVIQLRSSSFRYLAALLLSSFSLSLLHPCFAELKLHLSEKEAAVVGQKIWRNECSGSIEGLTSWNAGEEFPSLGIGHFIWYTDSFRGPFEESFPKMLSFLQEHNAKIPAWLSPTMHCPWKSREEFLNQQKSPQMLELRQLLSSTVPLQTEFIVQRMQDALPKMLEKAPESSRAKVQKQFDRVLSAGSAGAFALIDYVNFKGEGINDKERYKGEGWGLLQVLQGMSETDAAVKAFSDSAIKALTLRVQNSPPERHESRWLPGWTRRVKDYVQ